MGAWGPAIFSDDLACDIRTDYRELLEDGVEDGDARDRVIAEYEHLSDDEAHILWLALAAAQVALGRLDETVREQALRIIDNEVGLQLWVEAGSKILESRKAALRKLRASLTGAQKTPSKVRRPWSHVTDLQAGAVLAYTRPEGGRVLFRVARLDVSRYGATPVVRQLGWNKPTLPSARRIRWLKTMPGTSPMGGQPSTSFYVARYRKKDPDWSDAGFQLVSHVSEEMGDATFLPQTYLDWVNLARNLDNGW